nr:hypothetical protein [Clostridium sp.]
MAPMAIAWLPYTVAPSPGLLPPPIAIACGLFVPVLVLAPIASAAKPLTLASLPIAMVLSVPVVAPTPIPIALVFLTLALVPKPIAPPPLTVAPVP